MGAKLPIEKPHSLGGKDSPAYPSPMNACPECGVENPSYSRFCMGCGTGLLVLCASCGEPTPTEAPFCPSCGSAIETAVGSGGEMIKLVTILFADVVGSTAQAE